MSGSPERRLSEPLELEGLGVRYLTRPLPALQEIRLAVAEGEIVAVAGRNGAGKSTLALAAAGFIPRVVRAELRGDVRIEGRSTRAATLAQLLGRVGIVFASPASQLSSAKLTVREELAFGLENLGVPRAEMAPRIERVLDELGIAPLAERFPLALSGGEQQRVAIASILVMGPNVLVLDEPAAQLDPAATAQIAEILKARAAAGGSVLVTEHKASVLGRADRCLVLEAGRSVALDSPGCALGSAVLEPLGMTAPTLVQVAERLGLDPALAFSPDELAAAIRARPVAKGEATPAAVPHPTPPGGPAPWGTVRDVRPVGLRVEGLSHRYPDGTAALKGVDLAIPAGQAVALVGQNGSGKTTLVKQFVGLLRPSQGRALVDERDIAGTPIGSLARTIGFVFQNPDDQLFGRTVARDVAYGPTNLGLAPDPLDRLVRQALAAVGLTEVASAHPYDLDLAARKLVALAGILAMDPAVIVLDEPTTGQDGPGIERVAAVVESYVAAGRTVVAVTHDMEFAARHFGRIVVMRDGLIVADGSPQEVFAPAGEALLASTGLSTPPAARVAAALGLGTVPFTANDLLAALPG